MYIDGLGMGYFAVIGDDMNMSWMWARGQVLRARV